MAAALACIPLIGGIIFYIVEKHDAFVRFYAMQSIIFGGAWLLVLSFLAFFNSQLSFIRLPTTKIYVHGKATRFDLGPGWRAWMGTDKSANDVFAKCIAGAKITLEIGFISTVVGLFLGCGGLFLAMSNALKPITVAAPAASPTPIVISIPAAPPSAASAH